MVDMDSRGSLAGLRRTLSKITGVQAGGLVCSTGTLVSNARCMWKGRWASL